MKEPFVNIAIQAARAAGNVIMRARDRLDRVKVTEKSPNDYVTEVDQKAEQEIIAIIRKAFPQHVIIGEEGGRQEGESEYEWIIDPLDGTRNFIHGFPHFAVSIAVRCQGRLEHGVVYDPVRDDLFTASRGRGAQMNDRRLRVSSQSQLEACLLGTGFPFRHRPECITAYTRSLESMLPKCGDVRRAGAAALDLAYVAAGRLDGFWEMGLKIWDVAAGALLVREAGGLLTDFAGGEGYLDSGNVIAANPKILKLMLKQLGPYLVKFETA